MASVLRTGICAAVCASALSVWAAFTDPSQIQTEAYIHLVQGDQSLDSGRLDEALEHYTVSRDFYLQIAEEFPDYQPRIVAYRADYCSDQIDLLMLRLGETPSPGSASPPPPPAANFSLPPEEDSVAAFLPPGKPTLLAPDAPSSPKAAPKAKKSPPESSAPAPEPLPVPTVPTVPSVPTVPAADLAAAQEQLAALQAERDALAARTAELEAAAPTVPTVPTVPNVPSVPMVPAADLEAARQTAIDLSAQVASLSAQLLDVQDQCHALQQDADDARTSARDQTGILVDLQDDNRRLEKDLEDASARIAALSAALDSANACLAEAQARAAAAENALRLWLDEQQAAVDLPADDADWEDFLDSLRRRILAGGATDVLASLDDLPPPPEDFLLPLAIVRSSALVRVGQGPEAVGVLAPFAEECDEVPDFHVAYGTALLSAGRLSEARASLLRATKLSRDLPPEAYANLALLYACTSPKNLRSARKHYQKALDLGLPPVPSLAALLD